MEHVVKPLNNRSNEVLVYWSKLKRGNPLPVRTELQPAALKNRLPDLFLLGWEETDLKFRLAGTRICEMFGTELRQANFLHIFQSDNRSQVTDAVLNAVTLRQGCRMAVDASNQSRLREYEMLLLPLNSPEGVCDRILGSLIPREIGYSHSPVAMGTLRTQGWAIAEDGSEEEGNGPVDLMRTNSGKQATSDAF